jgi:hypothetical protein
MQRTYARAHWTRHACTAARLGIWRIGGSGWRQNSVYGPYWPAAPACRTRSALAHAPRLRGQIGGSG